MLKLRMYYSNSSVLNLGKVDLILEWVHLPVLITYWVKNPVNHSTKFDSQC